jgi:sulfopropanediol 3-dehydrogenase
MSPVASRLSRIEGIKGHARACDWRLSKYYPEESYDFEVYRHGIK